MKPLKYLEYPVQTDFSKAPPAISYTDPVVWPCCSNRSDVDWQIFMLDDLRTDMNCIHLIYSTTNFLNINVCLSGFERAVQFEWRYQKWLANDQQSPLNEFSGLQIPGQIESVL